MAKSRNDILAFGYTREILEVSFLWFLRSPLCTQVPVTQTAFEANSKKRKVTAINPQFLSGKFMNKTLTLCTHRQNKGYKHFTHIT
jgi:hypothetical protein